MCYKPTKIKATSFFFPKVITQQGNPPTQQHSNGRMKRKKISIEASSHTAPQSKFWIRNKINPNIFFNAKDILSAKMILSRLFLPSLNGKNPVPLRANCLCFSKGIRVQESKQDLALKVLFIV